MLDFPYDPNHVTIAIFMHRLRQFHPAQMESLARHTLRSFDLVYVFEKGSAHQNIQRCLDRAKNRSRYLCLCDDDVIFMEDHWLDTLIEVLKEYKDVGTVTPVEIKQEHNYKNFKLRGRSMFDLDEGTIEATWNPGYVMLFDMSRCPPLKADLEIPGNCFMSDVDLCLQVRQAGYKCAQTSRTIVYHPAKPKDPEWRMMHDVTQSHEQDELANRQIQYMTGKWGAFYTDNMVRRFTQRLGD